MGQCQRNEQTLDVEVKMSNKSREFLQDCLFVVIGLPILLSLGAGFIFVLPIVHSILLGAANSLNIPVYLVYLVVFLLLLLLAFLVRMFWRIITRRRERISEENNIELGINDYIGMAVGLAILMAFPLLFVGLIIYGIFSWLF